MGKCRKENKPMKRIVSIILTVCLIAGCIPAFTAAAETAETRTPRLRIGVISDLQCNNTTDDGMKYAIKAFEKFKSLGVDVVINAGDIADSNAPTIYQYYLEQFHKILPGVTHVSVAGNHDIWYGDKLATYKQYFGEPNQHITVNGFHFITISSEPDLGTATNGNYGKTSKNFASFHLNQAAQTAGGDPIFVITHQHIQDTVYVSESWGNDFLHGIIEDYPNAVSLSGHSHAPLTDERSIWQGDFTAIGTCCLSYTELEYGKDNGSVPPNASDCKEYMYIEVFDDTMEVTRIKAQTGNQIKDKWILDLPLQKSTFKYTGARADSRTAPSFAAGSKITTTVSKRDVTFSFPAAYHDDFVHSYRIKITKKGETAPIKNILIFSDFYKGLENMNSTVNYTVKDCVDELQFYTVEIYPIESFGHEGEPLVKDFSSIEDTQLPKLSRGNVFTVDFVNGEPRNATGTAVLTCSGGTVEKADSKWAYTTEGDGKLTVTMSNSYYTLTAKKFTVEAVFSVNDFSSVQTVMSCYSNGGTEMFVDTDGKVKYKVYTADGDIVLAAPISADRFHDVAVTYNGSKLILYVDGEEKDSCNMSGSVAYNRTMNYSICAANGGKTPFRGTLYTACVNSAAKTADEIKALYDAKDNGYNLELLKPVAEEARRMEILKQKNPANQSVNVLADNYLAELHAILDSYYFLQKDATAIVRTGTINGYLEKMGCIGLDDTYTAPVISGVENGARYDLLSAAPAATWDTADEALLNGEPYVAGTPIENAGKQTLIVWNGDKVSYAEFETYVSYVAPVISGIEDGEEYDLYKGEAPSIYWTPAELEGKLDSAAYVPGTPVTEPGWHTFMLSDGKTTLVFAFKIIDTTPVVSGISDGDVFDIAKVEAPAATWNFEGTATLDGEAYEAGTPVTALGNHVLVVTGPEDVSITVNFTVKKVIKGDFDGDEDITVMDALTALRISVELVEETPEYVEIGDCDGDGHVTVVDALMILRVAAKLTEHL